MAINGYLGGVISATAPSVTTAGASGVFTLEEQLQAAGQNNWPGYQISRSLRLRASAGAYLNRTFGTPTNGKIWTFSTWFKLGNGQFGPGGNLLGTADNGGASGNYVQLGIDYTNGMMYINDYSSGTAIYVTSSNLLRDSSAWYHLMYVYDSTQATAANRIIYYINGVKVTSYSNTTYPSQNYNTYINNSGQVTYFGANYSGSVRSFVGSYFADSYFIDGQALTPASFGAFDAVTGVWNPIRYTGTYGNNGFYLNYSDNSAATATTIGKDYSGNGNNWTPNNISVTAGTTYDSMVDVPIGYGSDTGVGGELRGNYAVMNPLDQNASLPAPTNGNLNLSNAATAWFGIRSTIAVTSGKWYAEVTQTGSNSMAGVMSAASALTFPLYTGSTGVYGFFNNGAGTAGYPYSNGSSGTTFTIASGDVIGLAYDFDAQTLAIYRNGALQATVTSIPKTTPMFFCAFFAQTTATQAWNFGQRLFSYTAPSGFKALCTQNLPTPTVSNGANYMAANLYTGTGASQTINNSVNSISFQPDLVWVKSRSAGTDNKLTDSVRGVTKGLVSNSAAAETTDTNGLTAFGATGFTLGSDTNYNNSGATYVGWQWQAAKGTTVTNTAGSLTSTVSANTTAGFSIVTYTGTIANATVGHGLGIAPQMIIARNRTNIVDWIVYHVSLTSASYYMTLNQTNAQTNNSIFWQGVAPTSTVFSLGANSSCNGTSSNVAYCFAPIAGYSAFGSYTGNGSTDGPFVYCGFRPRFVLVKRWDSTGNWFIWDAARNTYNAVNNQLYPDSSSFEQQADGLDFVSNGFKIRFSSTYADRNASGGTYLYAAFAENPFNISRAR